MYNERCLLILFSSQCPIPCFLLAHLFVCRSSTVFTRSKPPFPISKMANTKQYVICFLVQSVLSLVCRWFISSFAVHRLYSHDLHLHFPSLKWRISNSYMLSIQSILSLVCRWLVLNFFFKKVCSSFTKKQLVLIHTIAHTIFPICSHSIIPHITDHSKNLHVIFHRHQHLISITSNFFISITIYPTVTLKM